jgi:hypothetical protein
VKKIVSLVIDHNKSGELFNLGHQQRETDGAKQAPEE